MAAPASRRPSRPSSGRRRGPARSNPDGRAARPCRRSSGRRCTARAETTTARAPVVEGDHGVAGGDEGRHQPNCQAAGVDRDPQRARLAPRRRSPRSSAWPRRLPSQEWSTSERAWALRCGRSEHHRPPGRRSGAMRPAAQSGHADRAGPLEHSPIFRAENAMAERMSVSLTVRSRRGARHRDPHGHRAWFEVAGQAVGHGRLDVDRHESHRPPPPRSSTARPRTRPRRRAPRCPRGRGSSPPAGRPRRRGRRRCRGRAPGRQLAAEGGLTGDDVGVVVGRDVATALAGGQVRAWVSASP